MTKIIDYIIDYITDPIHGTKEKILFMSGALILEFVVAVTSVIIIFNILGPMGIIDTSDTSSHMADIDTLSEKGYIIIVLILFISALVEELMFRFPLVILNNNRNIQFIAIVLFSILFGLVHGDIYNIFIQGSSGIILSIVFLKCGGSDPFNNKNVLIGLLCSTTVHATFNIITITMI